MVSQTTRHISSFHLRLVHPLQANISLLQWGHTLISSAFSMNRIMTYSKPAHYGMKRSCLKGQFHRCLVSCKPFLLAMLVVSGIPVVGSDVIPVVGSDVIPVNRKLCQAITLHGQYTYTYTYTYTYVYSNVWLYTRSDQWHYVITRKHEVMFHNIGIT